MNSEKLRSDSGGRRVIFFQGAMLRNCPGRGTKRGSMSVFLYLACPTFCPTRDGGSWQLAAAGSSRRFHFFGNGTVFEINRLSLTYVFRSETFLAISCLAARFKRLISSDEVRRCVESKGLKPSHLDCE